MRSLEGRRMRSPCSRRTYEGWGFATATRSFVSFTLLLALEAPQSARAALNVGLERSDELVQALRKNIFVDAAYLTEREKTECSSLDGPHCFNFAAGIHDSLGELPASAGAALDAIGGVVPERLIAGLGVQKPADHDFSIPGYMTFQAIYEQLNARLRLSDSDTPRMLGMADDQVAILRESSSSASGGLHTGESRQGVLSFDGLLPDRRVPVTFSQGLPSKVVATWDGKWMVRDCLGDENRSVGDVHLSSDRSFAPVFDPARRVLANDAMGMSNELWSDGAPGMHLSSAQPVLGFGQDANEVVRSVEVGKGCGVVARLSSSLGYLRFSNAVVVRSLFVRWKPDFEAPAAI